VVAQTSRQRRRTSGQQWHDDVGDVGVGGGGGSGVTGARQMKTVAPVQNMEQEKIDPAYMRRLSDEYRRVVLVNPAPHIFIGLATSPTNMCHIRW
jgi:hypothetical protein